MIGGRIQLPDVAILARTAIRIGSVSRIVAASVSDNDALRDTATTWGVLMRTTGSGDLRSGLSSWSVGRVPTVAGVESLEALFERRQPVGRRRS